jgi:hypothetical protein
MYCSTRKGEKVKGVRVRIKKIVMMRLIIQKKKKNHHVKQQKV